MENKKGILSQLAGFGPFKVIAESIRYKVLVALLLLSLVPLITVGVVNYLTIRGELQGRATDILESVNATKSTVVQGYFEGRREDMNALVETVQTLRTNAFNQLTTMRQLKKSVIENFFKERLSNVNALSKNPVFAQAVSEFERIMGPIGGDAWREVNRNHGDYLTEISENYGFYDLFLISTNGLVVYTVAQEWDMGQNLINGELAGSAASKAFQRGLNGLVYQDFEVYAPAGDAPASFIAAPIIENGVTKGVVMVQVSIDQINGIMQERTGLGETGETYLIGPDGMFRSDSIHIEESTILNPAFVVDAEGANQALQGNTGEAITVNYRDEYVLSAWTPIKIQDLTWALMTEVDVTEAFVPRGQGDEADFFTKYSKGYGYYDMGLVNPDGYLFYTVEKRQDYQTNLLTGPYKDTNLGQLVSEVMKTKSFGIADFAKYAPDMDAPAAFFAQPVVHEDKINLIVVTKMALDRIDVIMQESTGLGETGESFLVGPDKMWRNNSRFLDKRKVATTVLNDKLKITTQAADLALAGKTGKGVMIGSQGKEVLSAWAPITIMEPTAENPNGIKWALISEIEWDEIMAPMTRLNFIMIGIFVFFFGLVILVALYLSNGLTTQVRHIMDLFGEIGIGNFEARTSVTTSDELGTMAFSLNAMLDNTLSLIQSTEERDQMQASVMRLLNEISGLAEGNLTSRAEVTEDFTGAIADSFNDMAEQLGRVVRNVKEVTLQVSATSQEVSTSTENLAETSEMQAVQVSDAIAAINEMATSIQQVAENASQCATVSEQATVHSKEGAQAVSDTNMAMESIREYVQETARTIKRLGESSQEIGNIVQLINDIADRTSILALNASIQAAMAGDAGRGFAVVAEEVQRLAERSTNATKQIDTLIKNIQGEINEAGTSMEESIQRVVGGSKLADNAIKKLRDIEKVTLELGELIQSISMASKQQARASENIAKTMEEVGEISSQTSAASRQTAVSMKNLADVSDQLNDSVQVFKVEEDTKEAA